MKAHKRELQITAIETSPCQQIFHAGLCFWPGLRVEISRPQRENHAFLPVRFASLRGFQAKIRLA
jgi:hypothetical protein